MPRARPILIFEQKIRRLKDQEKNIPGNPNTKSIVDRYCDAWNRGDLDTMFALFAEDARYEGAATQLNGRADIRKMYERTFASGEGRGLVVRPIETAANSFSLAVYRGEECVAVKQFEITDGLMVLQSMRACLGE